MYIKQIKTFSQAEDKSITRLHKFLHTIGQTVNIDASFVCKHLKESKFSFLVTIANTKLSVPIVKVIKF